LRLWSYSLLHIRYAVNFVVILLRLTVVEELAKAANKKLTQGMSEHNKALSAAKTDAEKAEVVTTHNPP
jgi:hypothetical protein